MSTLAELVSRLEAGGYRRALYGRDGRLFDRSTQEAFAPEELSVAEVIRLEGDSDPDEQLIGFALRARGGAPLGVYVVVFGPSMPRADVEVVRKLRVEGARAGGR